jgi:membrane-bound lytic murein transglycosylase D
MRRLAGRDLGPSTWARRALGTVSALGVLGLVFELHADPASKPAQSAPTGSSAARPSAGPGESPSAKAPQPPKPFGPRAPAPVKPSPKLAGKAGSGPGTATVPPDATGESGAGGSPGSAKGTESDRSTEEPSAPPKPGAPKPAAPKPKGIKSAAAKPPPFKPHQRGRAPRQPIATLPPGVSRSEPNEAARRLIAAGPTGDEGRAEKTDPELRALSEAERVLFPRPLAGVTPGWNWDLPRPAKGSGPTVSSSGAPPGGPREIDSDQPSREDAAWLKSLSLPNLPVRLDARVVKYLKFYRDNPKGKSIVRVWAQKSGKYAPSIQAELVKSGLPTDLVWLSLIESGHNPSIQSPAGAVGLWQFVPETARLYGLTVDRWVDERLDPKRSTEAAILYLSDLKKRFGSWELAIAAYNMGFGGLGKAIRKYNTNDFWQLGRHEAGIPWETTLYVPKILATAIVMNNKKAFGIADVVPAEPVASDTVLVKPATPLSRVAAAAQIALPQIEELNPQYLASRTPPAASGKSATFAVRVPTGKGAGATQRLANVGNGEAEFGTYVVRFGDTPKCIATELGVIDQQLVKLNSLGDTELLEAGTVLLVPKGGNPGARDPEESVVVVPASEIAMSGRRRVFFRTRQGDALAAVSGALGVTPSELVGWNMLDPHARLQPGMVLQAFVPKNSALDRVRHLEEKDARVVVVGSQDFFDYFEGLNGKKRISLVAKAGDTLRSIGARYGMTVGSMERVNRRSNTEPLVAGETVIVYAPQTALAMKPAKAGETGEVQPLPALAEPTKGAAEGTAEAAEAAGER